jgi:pimeloyl-ACP methyl ester carboxylesterase
MHGFSLTHQMWDEQVEVFSRSYRVVCYDARGHGLSDSPETGYSREERANDLLNLADYLNIGRFNLVGFSMGGGDALYLAIERQEKLITLTLVGAAASGYKPTTKMRDYGKMARETGLEEAKRAFIKSSLSRYDSNRAAIKGKLEKMMNQFSGRYWLDPNFGKHPKRDDVRLSAKIRIPSLIIAGKNDISWAPLSRLLSETILDARLELLPGVGHMVNLEAPDKFNSILRSFLSDKGGGKLNGK